MPNTTRSNTGSSSHLSPTSNATQPAWPAPRAPLAPHRLAKLANALGVSTPVPATHASQHTFTLGPTSPTAPNTSSTASFQDPLRRSPTPGLGTAQFQATSSTSKYLLHVIPPSHLPHDIDDLDVIPPPPTASGYHTQFRRGVMVPVYSTLQSQLGAIAREYSLPSTVGMIVYLITSLTPEQSEEPGPRISEDIWKHIWTRVLRAEKDEFLSPGPKPFGLGFGMAGRSSPALLQDLTGNQSLRALTSPRLTDPPQPLLSPSPSTPSQSVYSSQSEIELEAPESASSVGPPIHSNSLPLPGLDSPALIPILAKVEFDIDRRKAGWYDPWLRSRKNNHAKRAESRLGARSASRLDDESEAEDGEAGVRKAPLDLRLVGKMEKGRGKPNFLLTAETEEPEDDGQYQQLDDDEEEPTARLDGEQRDPLQDVFGEDEETWAEMHASGEKQPRKNANVVDLALDAKAVSNLPDDLEDGDESRLSDTDDLEEVAEIVNRLSKPALFVSIPSSPTQANKRRSSPTTAGTVKKHVPPPLNLLPAMPGSADLPVPEASPMALSSGDPAELAYLEGERTPSDLEHAIDDDDDDDHLEVNDDVLKKSKSPDVEKREGAFFEDLDLGLDPSLTMGDEYDDNDPYDRRKSQFIMSAQLDEIEKTLAQFSPRRLQTEELTPEELPHRRGQSIASIRAASLRALSPRMNSNLSPPKSSAPLEGASWPAVPYAVLNGNEDQDEDRDDMPPSPPKFAFNGISTEPPKPYRRSQARSSEISNETLARQRALAEDNGLYPPLSAPSIASSGDSPVIPLSPDPFGRYPSEAEVTRIAAEERGSRIFDGEPVPPQGLSLAVPPGRGSSLGVQMDHVDEGRPASQTPSSRFSLDSVASEEATKAATKQPTSSASLMSVKSIRKLWRKSNSSNNNNNNNNNSRSSISVSPQPPESGRTSPNVAAAVPQGQFPAAAAPAPAGRSRSKSITKQPAPPPPPPMSGPQLATMGPPINAFNIPMARGQQSMRRLYFDQESPYPIHPVRPSGLRSPSPPPHIPLRPPSQQQQQQQQQSPPSSAPLPAPPPPPPLTEKSSVRKSILKSWKSASGSLSSGKSSGSISRPSSTTPRSSMEQLPETAKKRRPSVLDIATGGGGGGHGHGTRGSLSGSSMSSATLVDIPPSPALPEQFLSHARSASRQSQNTTSTTNGRPSMSSSITTASSPPRVRSPLTSTSPPAGAAAAAHNGLSAAGVNQRASVESYESRFDVSQFEMVSPPKGSLSYPYHGLDQSVMSQSED